MRTITIDIINDKVLNLLLDLEQLQLIRVRKEKPDLKTTPDWAKYKGAMTKQPLDEINRQLTELRDEWE